MLLAISYISEKGGKPFAIKTAEGVGRGHAFNWGSTRTSLGDFFFLDWGFGGWGSWACLMLTWRLHNVLGHDIL